MGVPICFVFVWFYCNVRQFKYSYYTMSNKYCTDKILEIADINDGVATCKTCRKSMSIRGIASHFYVVHTDVGQAHTEKVKNYLRDYCVKTKHNKTKCEFCDKSYTAQRFSTHAKSCLAKRQRVQLACSKQCEICKEQITVYYGSGRFCGIKCAKSAASAKGQDEANEKRRQTLIRKGIVAKIYHSKCKTCDKELQAHRKPRKFCSSKCASADPKRLLNLSNATKKSIERGNPFPKRIRCQFQYNDKLIKCDSRLEWTCLDWIMKNYDVKSLTRSQLKLAYTLDDHNRTYNPDFEFETTNNEKYVVEAKSEQSPKSPAWVTYTREANEKHLVLDDYCKENNLKSLWYTQNTNIVFYKRSCKLFDDTVRKGVTHK